MRLLELVTRLTAQQVRTLSRVVITPGPGRCEVQLTFASWSRSTMGAMVEGKLEPMSGPRRLDEQQSADAVLSAFERAPDVYLSCDSAALSEQLTELRDAGIVGGLLVEQLGGGRRTVVSTHAGTQDERNAWLRQL